MSERIFDLTKKQAKPLIQRISRISPPLLNRLYLWLAEKYLRFSYDRDCRFSYQRIGKKSQVWPSSVDGEHL